MLQEVILFCGIMSYVAIRSSFYPLKIMVGFAWFGAFAYWLTHPVVTIAAGSPTDTIIMLVLMGLGLTFIFMGIGARKPVRDIEEETSPTGNIIRRIEKFTVPNKEPSTNKQESTLEYRTTVRKALSRGKKINR